MAHRDNQDASELNTARQIEIISGYDEWNLQAIPELNLEPITVADGPHGLRRVAGEKLSEQTKSLPATCFPTASALAASWDPTLAARVGIAVAEEARAQGVSVVLGPGINIKRHPLCGRNFEYFSEDPLLSGKMAVGFIDGVQSQGIGTSLKHFAVNNQESYRLTVDAIVDERTLRELYLYGFEIAVRESQPWTVMTAYNQVNGLYCSDSPWLLSDVLRSDWGFEGLTVSDWGGNNDRIASISAGLDLEMPGGSSTHDEAVQAAIDDGSLPPEHLATVANRVIALMKRAIELGPDSPEDADMDEHHDLARAAAADSMVLLKNRDNALPLSPTTTVALIGEFAENAPFQGSGSSRVNANRVDRLKESLAKSLDAAGGAMTYSPGYDALASDRPDLIDDAVAAARAANHAVVVVGLPPSWEVEGVDRRHMEIPEQHSNLVQAVARTGVPTTVVLINGSPVAMPWIDQVDAVLEAYLGGQAAGAAIADVLTGASEPGGRLAETFPLRQRDVASDRWFPGVLRQVQYREGLLVGYRWFDTAERDVLFPFGHGLSYSTFSLTDPKLLTDVVAEGEPARIQVSVTNTGDRDGSTVVQTYVQPLNRPSSLLADPIHELAGFQKVALQPGETTRVELEIQPRAFAHWDTTTGSWQTLAGDANIEIGTSSREIHHTFSLSIKSEHVADASPATTSGRHPKDPNWHVDQAAFEAILGHAVSRPIGNRPFHRNSTFGEVGETWLGKPFYWTLTRVITKAAAKSDPDGGLSAGIAAALDEMPIRNLAAMSRGAVSIAAVDRVIRVLNKVSSSK